MVLLTNHHLVTSHFNILSSCTGQNLSKQVLTEIGPVHTYPDILNPQLFFYGYGFRPKTYPVNPVYEPATF